MHTFGFGYGLFLLQKCYCAEGMTSGRGIGCTCHSTAYFISKCLHWRTFLKLQFMFFELDVTRYLRKELQVIWTFLFSEWRGDKKGTLEHLDKLVSFSSLQVFRSLQKWSARHRFGARTMKTVFHCFFDHANSAFSYHAVNRPKTVELSPIDHHRLLNESMFQHTVTYVCIRTFHKMAKTFAKFP